MTGERWFAYTKHSGKVVHTIDLAEDFHPVQKILAAVPLLLIYFNKINVKCFPLFFWVVFCACNLL